MQLQLGCFRKPLLTSHNGAQVGFVSTVCLHVSFQSSMGREHLVTTFHFTSVQFIFSFVPSLMNFQLVCSGECLITTFIAAHMGVRLEVGFDVRFQVVSSGKTLTTSFLRALSNYY